MGTRGYCEESGKTFKGRQVTLRREGEKFLFFVNFFVIFSKISIIDIELWILPLCIRLVYSAGRRQGLKMVLVSKKL